MTGSGATRLVPSALTSVGREGRRSSASAQSAWINVESDGF
jgi:hypothetical protein